MYIYPFPYLVTIETNPRDLDHMTLIHDHDLTDNLNAFMWVWRETIDRRTW